MMKILLGVLNFFAKIIAATMAAIGYYPALILFYFWTCILENLEPDDNSIKNDIIEQLSFKEYKKLILRIINK